MVRILIADGETLFRSGIVTLCNGVADFTVVGEASDGAEAARLCAELSPDVVLADAGMPELDGIARTTGAKTVILTSYGPNENVPKENLYRALAAGARGFLFKDMRPERLIEAVRRVAEGEIVVAPDVTRRLVESYLDRTRVREAEPPGVGELTAREREVLRRAATGATNAEIADDLSLSEGTVKTHVKRIMSKLHLRTRAQAVVVAYETGLVTPGVTGSRR